MDHPTNQDPRPSTSARRLPKTRGPLLFALLLGLGACTPIRTLTIESNPSGATVRLDEAMVGQTPLVLPFDHHGSRRVSIYLEGYQVWTEITEIKTPWWAYFPLDLISDHLIPWQLHDEHKVHAAMTPGSGAPLVTGWDQFIEHTRKVHAEERGRSLGTADPLTPTNQDADPSVDEQ